MRAMRRICLLTLVWGGIVYAQKAEFHKSAPPHTNGTLSDSARLEWVRHFTTNSVSSVDFATDVAMDASGFVYVTGKSESTDAGRDYLTIKYNPLGQEVWRAQYDGPAHADDVPSALAVDAAGNVYVTGMSMGPAPCIYTACENYDYATVKYNAVGQEQWVTRYSGPGNMTDGAVAIALDATGNVYVTGQSDHADSTQYGRYGNADLATIKYNSSGAQQWVRRYDGPKISQDAATALVLDDSSNVYVTGSSEIYSYNPWFWRTAATAVKYNSDGVAQWTTSIGQDSTHFSPVGICLDGFGGAYVVGRVSGWEYWIRPAIFVTRLTSSGQKEWLRSYDSLSGMNYLAASLAVDPSGNVLVAGVGGADGWWLGLGDFILTMKYGSSGDLLWARQYRDRQRAYVRVTDMVVDRAGNAYVTGSSGQWYSTLPFMGDSIVTLKYDANGVPQWVVHYTGVAGSKNEAAAIVVDVVGNVVVAGASGPEKKSDFLTIKLTASGNREWDARATGEGASFESLAAMTLDAAGNVYVTGSSIAVGTSSDYITAKFNPNGNKLWSARYNSPENGYDHPTTIVVDAQGNVHVTGSSTKGESAFSYTTAKYGPDGVQRWVSRYEGVPSWYVESPNDMIVDSSGNVFVGGARGLVKYDNQGNEWWRTADTVYAMTLDRQNSLYISTPTRIIKLDSMGVRQTLIASPATDIAVDDSGSVYLTLYDGGQYTKKYSPSGSLLWSYSFGGSQIRLDRSGNAIVKRPYGSMLAFKLTPAGALAWSVDFQSGFWGPTDFALDKFGSLYLAGPREISPPLASIPAFYVVKYNSSGVHQWSAQYNSPDNLAGTPYAIGVDGFGNAYVAGTTQREDFSPDITIVKCTQVTVSVKEDETGAPLSYSLSQNYPNPFNPSTTIRFALPKSGHVELKVYNLLGQEVATLANEEKNAGTYSTQWNAGSVASGVYFYRLQAGEYGATRKLVLLR